MTDINVDLLQWSMNFLIKKLLVVVLKMRLFQNGPLDLATRELAEELRKPIIRKFNKRKVQLPFINNIWGADLQSVTKYSGNFKNYV